MKLNLSNRITFGYVILIAVTVAIAGYSISILQRHKTTDRLTQSVYLPLYLKLKDLAVLNQETSRLINHWIYQPGASEKDSLVRLQEKEYPRLKKKIRELSACCAQGGDSIRQALGMFDQILSRQRKVMATLAHDSLYADDEAVDAAIEIWENHIRSAVTMLDRTLSHLLERQRTKIDYLQQKEEEADAFLSGLLVGMIVISVLAFLGTYAYTKRSVIAPVTKAKDLIVSLGQGKLIDVPQSLRDDEIGEMMQAMICLSNGMNAKINFADHIGKGHYTEPFELQSPEDVMGRALISMRDELKKKTAELDRFVYSASHDLRAPIASVKGLVNLMRLDASGFDLEQCFTMIDMSMNRLDNTIHEILDFFQNARSEVRLETLDLRRMLEEIIRDFSAEIGLGEVDFTVRYPSEELLLGDVMRMRVIFRNLLSNAIRFRNYHIPLRVVIDIRKEPDLIFSVQDNGIGIPPLYHERIFEMFFRGDAERSGVGLGLYIVKEVIGMLKGSITVRSSIGQGSVFTVQLPEAIV